MKVMQKTARLAGGLYLIYILVTVLANALGRSAIIVPGDAAQTAANILAHEAQFRLGVVLELVSSLLFILTALALYALLRPVGKHLSLSFLVLNLVGGAVVMVSAVCLFAVFPFVHQAAYLADFSAGQLTGLALFWIKLRDMLFGSAQLFYAAWTLPLGYLIYKSGYLPRALGVLLMADCFAVVGWFLQSFLVPNYALSMSYGFFAVSFLAEVALTLWLLIKGVNAAGWEKRAAAAA